MNLYDIAPRLAKARDDFLAERARIYHERAVLIGIRLNLEWSVAHRELQLQRSRIRKRTRNDMVYLDAQTRKLEESRRKLAEVERQLASPDLQPI